MNQMRNINDCKAESARKHLEDRDCILHFPFDQYVCGSVTGPKKEPLPDIGPTAAIATPAAVWRQQGSLGMAFQPSRTVSFAPSEEINFVDCPLFKASLQGTGTLLRFTLTIRTGDEDAPERSDIIQWSHLKGEAWYHLLFAWNAPAGTFEVYLNGTMQAKLRDIVGTPWAMPPVTENSSLILGEGGDAMTEVIRIAIKQTAVYASFKDEGSAAAIARNASAIPLSGEGRTIYKKAMNLDKYYRKLIYTANFQDPLKVVAENDLFQDGTRIRKPDNVDWVLEGAGEAWTENERLHIRNQEHTVLWNVQVFPKNFMLEFEFWRPHEKGLAIIFFNAASRDGRGIFELDLPLRDGVYKNYYAGSLNSYHPSYVSNGRRTANLRKSHGFFLTAVGNDLVHEAGPGPHTIRILKYNELITLEINGCISLCCNDNEDIFGPALNQPGHIGLRQMQSIGQAAYRNFKVWQVSREKL